MRGAVSVCALAAACVGWGQGGASAPGGVIATIAGNRLITAIGDGGPATSASLLNPTGLAVDAQGAVYIVDRLHYRVRKVAADGTITTVAGNGIQNTTGDGWAAVQAAMDPTGVAVDAGGTVYVAERMSDSIRKVTPQGTLGTFATDMESPEGLALGPDGALYAAAMSKNAIIRVAPDGTKSTVAGTGQPGFGGDGGPATQAMLNGPAAVAVNGAGDIYICDAQNHRIRKVTRSTGVIATIAGNGSSDVHAPSGDGGPAVNAPVPSPAGVAVDSAGNVYIAQWTKIRKVAPDGTISTVVGRDRTEEGENAYFCCTGVLATSARIWSPAGLAVDREDNLYIADAGNDHVVHKVTAEKYSGGPPPRILAVANAADWRAEAAPAAWIAIQGTNLAPATRGWREGDFPEGRLPEQLEGVRVYVEGRPIAISYVNPVQVNGMIHYRWNEPPAQLNGTVTVEALTPQGRSEPFRVARKGCSPALFRWEQDGYKWAIAQAFSDGAYIAPPGLIPGVATRAARPGEILTLYGTGFGPTSPPTPAGLLVKEPAPVSEETWLRTAGVDVRPLWAGVIMAGLYQINITTPALAEGDYEYTPEACAGQSGAGAWIPVRRQGGASTQ